MKKFWSTLSFANKIILLINGVVGGILLFAYLLPFIPPRYFEYASLSVFTPLLMLVNIGFIVLWLLRRQWLFLFSAVLFLIVLPFMHRFVQFSKSKPAPKDHLSIMSFNVRLKHLYQILLELLFFVHQLNYPNIFLRYILLKLQVSDELKNIL